MKTEETTMSKGDQLRAFFTENPDAATVATARQFECHAGYVSAIKKKMGLNRLYQARKKSAKKVKKVKSATHTNGTFKNGAGWSENLRAADWYNDLAATAIQDALTTANSFQVVAATPPPSLSPWADYGLWMDREQMRGYLRGRAVEYLTKGDKLSVEEALRCVTKLAELTGE